MCRADGDVVVRKGLDKRVDSYSGFGDAWGGKVERTELQGVLQRHGVEELFICGLALDVCVAFTCLVGAASGGCRSPSSHSLPLAGRR